MVLTPGWATYLRVSNEDKQTPERSFAMQRQRIEEQLLKPSKLPVFREYRDMLTGTTAKRADYQQLLADAASGRFSHLGLYRADRFGRDTVEGLQAATKLIALGVKIRIAHMPTLQPETPDGFFLFLIQMGLAQREVDVMRGRIMDGMEAKLRAGGWPFRAPEGYVNKEELIGSGKYRRWVEIDPVQSLALREAWDLLLTDRYTMDQICDELTARGYTRRTGKPWAWTTKRDKVRKHARSRINQIFHNPFYAGWAHSEKYGIPPGQIRGNWDPIVSNEEFERGIEILRKHDREKSRERCVFYLLRNLVWMQVAGQQYKMYGSSPRGHSKRYKYYLTRAKPKGKQIRVQCKVVDTQISDWLSSISVKSECVPSLRETYLSGIADNAETRRGTRMDELRRRLAEIRTEESQLARMFVTGKISEDAYDILRLEWHEKVRHTESSIADLEREVSRYIDDLDAALVLLARAFVLYERLEQKQRATLLQIIVKRIIVDADGEIIGCELHAPFVYLTNLSNELQTGRGSVQAQLGPP